MRSIHLASVGIVVCVVASLASVDDQSSGTVLVGKAAASATWNSGWLDLATPMDLKSGQKLRLTVGGTARRIIVRLQPKGADPDSMSGVIPRVLSVPTDRVVELVIPADSPQIVQISVHGGTNPWNQFPLGSGNGSATLLRAELMRSGRLD